MGQQRHQRVHFIPLDGFSKCYHCSKVITISNFSKEKKKHFYSWCSDVSPINME